ncbi:hypothetical protein GJ496_002505 [Pomphorhynchus laevis]|nr:hypothetical protein GJ496_002505 [Pomphorhynchus laevis]
MKFMQKLLFHSNLNRNYNLTEIQFADYLDNLITKKSWQIDDNVSLRMFDYINQSAFPQVLCLHSTCIPGKHIERVAREQTIGNPYGYACPTMFSKHNEFKYLKIDRIISNTEFLAQHIFPCVEYIEIIDNGDVDHMFILKFSRYSVKRFQDTINQGNIMTYHPHCCACNKQNAYCKNCSCVKSGHACVNCLPNDKCANRNSLLPSTTPDYIDTSLFVTLDMKCTDQNPPYEPLSKLHVCSAECLHLTEKSVDEAKLAISEVKREICNIQEQLKNCLVRESSLINVTGIDNAIDRMSCCKSLSKLDMSFNRITEFNRLYDILLNTKLRILNLSFNDIEYLKHVNENTSKILSKSILEVLDLSNNKLTLITMQWMLTPSLRVLNCSFNQIRNVYFSGFLLYGNASQLSTLNLANNQDLTFEQNIFDSLTGLTEIDLTETNLPSDSLPENVPNLCKIYLNRNSLWQYVRFTCKYNPEYEMLVIIL